MFNWLECFKKEKVVKIETTDNLIVTKLYRRNGRTFQFFCDSLKASGTKGENVNYCLKLLTEEGFVVVMDNRQLGVPDMLRDDTNEIRAQKIEEGFKVFKDFARFF